MLIQGPAVLYFADDDNTYDTRLFDEIRATVRVRQIPLTSTVRHLNQVSVFPIGLSGGAWLEGPVNNAVCTAMCWEVF